jgi:IclR family mhp operon transcriptional activator
MQSQLRSLDRGLKVLGYLNQVRSASAQSIAKAVKLPLPTVYRIVETLSYGGFVERTALPEKVYRLTIGVRRLSGGVTAESLLISVATPVLLQRRLELKWPSALATFEHDAMVIRESTDRFSPNSIGLNAVGMRIPMFHTPLGWVYLAFCREEERKEILMHLRKSENPVDSPAREPALVHRMIKSIRANGYSSSQVLRPQRCSGIALPILHRGAVLGCIGAVWLTALLSHKRAIPQCLPVLQEAKLAIEEGLKAANADW